MEQIFRECCETWERDTLFESSATRIVNHPAYLRIIGLGPDVLPLILEDLRRRGRQWFVALQAITGADPTQPGSTYQEAVDAWIEWGHENKMMS